MTLSFTVGVTMLPLPRGDDPYKLDRLPIGNQFRAADGALKTQLTGFKWRATVTWVNLSALERQTLYDVFANLLLTPDIVTFPDGLTFTASATLGSWSEQPGIAPWTATPFYDVAFTLEEA